MIFRNTDQQTVVDKYNANIPLNWFCTRKTPFVTFSRFLTAIIKNVDILFTVGIKI